MHGTNRSRRGGVLAVLTAAGLALAACSDSKTETEKVPPASLEEVAEGEIGKITLTDQAAQRLDIQTATVDAGTGGATLQVPFAAVIYQPDGSSWVYTNREGLVFLREPIEIDRDRRRRRAGGLRAGSRDRGRDRRSVRALGLRARRRRVGRQEAGTRVTRP